MGIVMEQWFSLMGIDDEEQIWTILQKNAYAMNKLRAVADGGTMVLSDMLTEWELGIGALQSKVIRRIAKHFEEEKKNNKSSSNDDERQSNNNQTDEKEEKPSNDNLNNGNANAPK